MADHSAPSKFVFPQVSYDVLKPFATTILPGLSALYAALGAIWGFPNVIEISGTISAINVFLGLLIGLSSRNYKQLVESEGPGAPTEFDGTVEYVSTEDGDVYRFAPSETDLDLAKEKGYLTFKVAPEDAS